MLTFFKGCIVFNQEDEGTLAPGRPREFPVNAGVGSLIAALLPPVNGPL